MQSNSTTVTLARVAKHLQEQYGGNVTHPELLHIMHEFGVHQNAQSHIDKMMVWKWLWYAPEQGTYQPTPESKQTATITITVPRLLAKEAYNDIVERCRRYSGIIEVGEVHTNED